ncbi:FmdB family zinc ribbon protein [Microlunatus flavus]|uniref:Putative regulatory protein, FmdB family n=1 Tax=Microlunatus flavus TaxID=1036181 RepID=A0A1H9JZL3_9ACTN|nr:FmdB family zinc ribbon protein [Microlunatus flavus]SEQ92218.1 putative regulatory protein, FmdB family [Microlunatus flavus]
MPTYQYRCTECGHDLEAVQKFSDAALTECPSCHGQLRKVYNAVGVVFKGSGFYRTDSRPKEGSSDGGSSSSSSKSTSSSDSSSNGSSGSNGSAGSNGSSGTNGSSSPKTETKAPAKAASSSTGSGSAA